MKILITKCSFSTACWYKDKIGEIFDVTVNEEFDDIYDLTDEEFEKVRSSKNSDETTLGFYISADDCLKL